MPLGQSPQLNLAVGQQSLVAVGAAGPASWRCPRPHAWSTILQQQHLDGARGQAALKYWSFEGPHPAWWLGTRWVMLRGMHQLVWVVGWWDGSLLAGSSE